MGIKGIYRELGPGKRASLSKLAVEHLETTGRPLRLAIDIAIWQFQAQAAKGGSNPAIRTLFYRLVRLLNHSIIPIFVFDGPSKPAFKRNKRSGLGGGGATAATKQLIRLFGLPIHDSPGEAEAECALLQQRGIVDAVLSEDVDTMMFGCTRTLRNWTAEGKRGSTAPTHVSVYESQTGDTAISGLGRGGLVLVALMSGGDYIPEGVPRCGVKLACEIARAGFGDDLCRLEIDDLDGIATWRRRLKHELLTNESGFFRTRHKALVIPETFPDLQVLRYYTHPAVSSAEIMNSMARQTTWGAHVDIIGLQDFVHRAFDWTGYEGAIKLIRVLSPSMLVQSILPPPRQANDRRGKVEPRKKSEEYVLGVGGRRAHWSVDGMTELRVSYIPASLVPLPLLPQAEGIPSGQRCVPLDSDDDIELWAASQETSGDGKASPKQGAGFDPLSPQTVWLPEYLARLGAPLAVESWETGMTAKARSKPGLKLQHHKKVPSGASKNRTNPGSLDNWIRTSKPANHTKVSAHVELLPGSESIHTLSSQSFNQKRMLHSEAKSTSNRSKPSKPSARAGTTGSGPLGDAWAQHYSQSPPRDANSEASQSIVSLSELSSAWPSPPPPPVRRTPDSFESNTTAAKPNHKDKVPPSKLQRGVASVPVLNKTSVAKPLNNRSRKYAADLKQTDITSYLDVTFKRNPREKTDSSPNPQPTKGPTLDKVTLFVPCPDVPGFLRQVEVGEDEAFALLGEDKSGRRVATRRAWRHSNTSLIDLTGTDNP